MPSGLLLVGVRGAWISPASLRGWWQWGEGEAPGGPVQALPLSLEQRLLLCMLALVVVALRCEPLASLTLSQRAQSSQVRAAAAEADGWCCLGLSFLLFARPFLTLWELALLLTREAQLFHFEHLLPRLAPLPRVPEAVEGPAMAAMQSHEGMPAPRLRP